MQQRNQDQLPSPPKGAHTRRSFIGYSAGVAMAVGGSSAFLAACGGSGSSGLLHVLVTGWVRRLGGPVWA